MGVLVLAEKKYFTIHLVVKFPCSIFVQTNTKMYAPHINPVVSFLIEDVFCHEAIHDLTIPTTTVPSMFRLNEQLIASKKNGFLHATKREFTTQEANVMFAVEFIHLN